MLKKHTAGFTLIELMITVAIIAILARISYPSYVAYVQRGMISEATGNLSEMRVRQERYFQDNRTYISSGTICNTSLAVLTSGLLSTYFTYTCTGTATTFTATATGKGGATGFTYTIDQDNNRQTTAFPGVSGTQTCWITKKGESC